MDVQFLDSELSVDMDVSTDLLTEDLFENSQLVGTNTISEKLEETAVLELVDAEEATHVAVKSGSWFDPSTWQNGEVPGANARIVIPEGIAVDYDSVSTAPLFSLRVDGEISFSPEMDTQMVIDTFVISPLGSLNIGSENNPIQSGVSTKIIIADNGPIDTLWDPNQLSRGVISLGAVNIHGQLKTPFLPIEMAPAAGDSSLVLEAIPEDWQVGDVLVIAASRQAGTTETEEESVTIQAIAGNRITLDRPLQFDHAPDTEALETYVANISRNVVIETENAGSLPVHQRGHVLLAANDNVDVRFAEFRELGRTDYSKPFDSTLIDQGDRTNIPGRYALQLNQVGNPDADSPAILMGNSIVGSPGLGYVQFDSHAVLEGNAAYDVIGAGFVAGTDQESGSWLNNIALKAETAYSDPLAQESIANVAADFWPQGAIASDGNISVESPLESGTTSVEPALETASLANSTVNSSVNVTEPLSSAAIQPAVMSMQATVDSLDARNVEMWEFEEWDLNNSTYSGNPFDLKASVTFTHTQSGEQRTTNMFYDGGNEWSFRFTGDLAGEWRFETDSADKDLDGFTGKINVSPNDNPEVDGFLTSVGNKFALQTDDANTLEGYLLNVYMNQADHFKQGELTKWDPSRTDDYLADARNNGSEVLYFQVNNNWFDFGSEKNSEHNSRNPDERTFELLEQVITDVHQQGGRVHFWAWGDRARGWTPIDGVNSEADQRLQSYIAARLGPLPGWSMGYSFDTQEFTDDNDMEFWADNLLSQMGWDHLLFARGYAASSDVPVNDSTSKNDWVAENLSGHSYSSKGKYQEGLQTSPVSPENIEEVIEDINTETSKPHFYEERFTYNRSSVGSTPGGPNDMDQTRQLMWWQAMAGGVGGWFGFFDWDGNEQPPYSNPEQLRTHYTFWHENDRFTLDLEQANNLADSSDTHLLKTADDSRYIVYTENRDSVQVDLPQLVDDSKVIAVDTKKNYREIDLGAIAEGNNRQIELPYRSDWAIVIESETRSGGGSTPVPPPEVPIDPPEEPEVPETPDEPEVPEVPETPTLPSEDPILWWTLDEGSGSNADDASGNNRDGAVSSGADWTAEGQINGALRLDGNQQLVINADAEDYLNGLDAITVSMWVKSDQVGSDRGFLSTVDKVGDDKDLGIRYDDRGSYGGGDDVIKLGLRTTEGFVEYESASNVQTQAWQHVVLSWKSGEAPKLYINGQLDNPTYAAPAIGGTLSGITDLIVGKGQRVEESWDGNIDDVRIYKRAVNAEEAVELFNLGDMALLPETPPVDEPSEPSDPTTPVLDDDPDFISSLERKARTKDLDALQEVYNVAFDERGKPDIHVGMAAEDVVLLKVQQNEMTGTAREKSDFVEESFDFDLTKNNIEIVGPNGQTFRPTAVHRKTKIADSAKSYKGFIVDHYFHIELPEALDADQEYTVRFTEGNLETINFTPEENVSLAIHHARVYDASTENKFAKLSSWMSTDGGGVDYEEGTPYRVIDEATGQVVHSGGITLDAADNFAGTDVYTLDLSSVKEIGTYRIEVEGIGKSLPFEVRENVWEDMLDLTMEGLYVHRAFAELEEPYTDFVRPGNPDIVFYPSSVSEVDFDFFDAGKEFEVLPATADRSKPTKLTGGWFDAGDYDTKSVHLEAVMSLVDLYNSAPDYFQSFDPNIPESGDHIPDVLNEAMWGMQLYKQLQQPHGGVSAGYEFDSHPSGTRSWEEVEAFIYAPDFRSSYRFAAAASKLSTALEPFDAAEAADLRERAIRAFDWAEQEFAKLPASFEYQGKADGYRQFASVEMYRLTGDKDYHDIFRSVDEQRNYRASFVYAQLDPEVYTAVDEEWQDRLHQRIIEHADKLVRYGEENGFDTINDHNHTQNWGYNTVITNVHSLYMGMAHQLTGDAKYLNALADSMPFGMGMNPDNMSFTTGTVELGLAYDEVDDVLHDDGQAMDHIPDGITVYGFYGNGWFAWETVNGATDNVVFNSETKTLEVPFIEAFNDYRMMVPMTEYTIHQTIDEQIYANGYLAAHAADQPTPARTSDALTGMAMSAQIAGDTDTDDLLTNYAGATESLEETGMEPSAGGNFSMLESTTNISDVDAIALTSIGNNSGEESEDSTFGDGLTAVTGTSPLEVDPMPQSVAV